MRDGTKLRAMSNDSNRPWSGENLGLVMPDRPSASPLPQMLSKTEGSRDEDAERVTRWIGEDVERLDGVVDAVEHHLRTE